MIAWDFHQRRRRKQKVREGGRSSRYGVFNLRVFLRVALAMKKWFSPSTGALGRRRLRRADWRIAIGSRSDWLHEKCFTLAADKTRAEETSWGETARAADRLTERARGRAWRRKTAARPYKLIDSTRRRATNELLIVIQCVSLVFSPCWAQSFIFCSNYQQIENFSSPAS